MGFGSKWNFVMNEIHLLKLLVVQPVRFDELFMVKAIANRIQTRCLKYKHQFVWIGIDDLFQDNLDSD